MTQSAPASFSRLADQQIEKVGQASGRQLVIAGLLVREQQAGAFGAPLRGRQTPLGIEQDGAGMLGEDFAHEDFEFLQLFVAGVGAESFLQRAALVHGSSSDDAAIVRNILHARKFSRSQFHVRTSTGRSPDSLERI